MRKTKTSSRKKDPVIKNVVGTTFPHIDKRIEKATAGTCIRIIGKRFGKDSKQVKVHFDGIQVNVLSIPFSESEAIVICPLPKKSTKGLFITVREQQSNIIDFSVLRPAENKEPVGFQTKKYFDTVDNAATLIAGFGRTVAPYTPYEKELTDASQNIDNSRIVLQTVIETLMKWEPLQAKMEFEPLKTIKSMDNIFYQSKLADGVHNYVDNLFGPSGHVANFVGSKNMDGNLFFGKSSALHSKMAAMTSESSAESESGSLASFLDIGGFIIHEITKLMEGGENFAKLFKPSAEAGAAVANVDVEFDWGQAISAIAKFIDIIAQIMMKIGAGIKSKAAGEKIDKLEAKADKQATGITNINTKLENVNIKIESTIVKIDKLEAKDDIIGEKLDKIELKNDKIEEKSDRLAEVISLLEEKDDKAETKLDVINEKIDKLEGKNDIMEEKMDRVEEKADRAELKLDKLEEKNDKEEEKLDKLEKKADKAEEKLDKIEEKLDKLEEKNDKEEEKLDKLEEKADKTEEKNDKIEGKLDKLEGKSDKIEGKLDKLEAKGDKAELKLDKLESKMDHHHHVLPVPNESSIASQRGSGDKVTAAILSIKATDNKTYLRCCINVDRDQVDNLANWSPWLPFGHPGGTSILTHISIDLQYTEGSDTNITAIATTRDNLGKIYTRSFKGLDHSKLVDAGEWTDWDDYLGQP